MADTPADTPGFSCPTPLRDHEHVTLAHGGGGLLSRELVERIFLPAFSNPLLAELGDAAVFDSVGPLAGGGRLAVSIDAHVVRPLFFPGGSIGELAVNGTVNDLAMSGATPIALAAAFILEEGLPLADLAAVVERMAAAARAAGVVVVAGDTKVVERGSGHGLSITTSGVGVVPVASRLGREPPRPGDIVLVSGAIGDHGMAVMSVRDGLEFDAPIKSDSAPLTGLVQTILTACPQVRLLRDPTRGGVAASLNEIAETAKVGIEIDEAAIPVETAVAAACELLGLDPLLVANEGKLLAIVPQEAADAVIAAMRSHELGRQAVAIGRIVGDHPRVVVMRTAIGGNRIIPMPLGDQLPRIC
jgi:hydrogenase expression/formation protein HypE